MSDVKDTKSSFALKSTSGNVKNVKSTSQLSNLHWILSNNLIYKSVLYIITVGNKHLMSNMGFNNALLYSLWEVWQ